MSTKRKRRKKKKEPIVAESATGPNVTPELYHTSELEPIPQESTEEEKILLTAPVLPWKIDSTYIAKDFRRAYVKLLQDLVNLHNLPYNVNGWGELKPK